MPPLHADDDARGASSSRSSCTPAWLAGICDSAPRVQGWTEPFLHPASRGHAGRASHLRAPPASRAPVCLTRANFEASARASAELLGVEPDDRWLCCLPVFHVGGLSIFTRSAIYGTTVVAEPEFDAARVKDLLEAGEVTLASLVPTMLARLRDAGLERAPELRADPPRRRADPGRAARRGHSTWACRCMPTYGMTETCSQIATAAPGERLARPLPGAEIRIADDGEILVRGPMVAADGWLHTGDRGHLTEDGLLEVEGRTDDVIVTGGENVAAREVEEAIRSHPAVTDAAVIGDRGRGVGQGGLGVRGRRRRRGRCRRALSRAPAGLQGPQAGRGPRRLPRTASGKVERAVVRVPRP